MTTTDDYIAQVLHQLPPATPLRAQIAAELRANIAERLAAGDSADAVLAQLGNPATLAESYLSAIPLVRAPFWRRAVAKLLDLLLLFLVIAPVMYVIGRTISGLMGAADAPTGMELLWIVCAIALVVTTVLFAIYTAVAEYAFAETVGKHLLGLQVVRESGARISFGQAIVRQLAGLFQVTFVDILLALFTEKHQRAFEMLSKTRVVMAPR